MVLVRVKEEPPDIPSTPSSCPIRPSSPTPPPPPPPPLSMVSNVTIKQEARDPDESISDTTLTKSQVQFHPVPAEAPSKHTQPQRKPEQVIPQSQRQLEELRLQQTALQINELHAAQQLALQKLLLQQQQNRQNQLQNQQNLQRRSQQRKKKSHKQQLKQQQQQQLLQQQIQAKQLQSQQLIQLKQQQSQQQQQIIQLKLQQQPQSQSKQKQLLLAKQQLQLQSEQLLQSQQVSQVFLNQQSGTTPSLPLDLLKTHSTPTLVTDSNGNHFLIALTNHTTENQGGDAPQGKPANHIKLQRLQSTPIKMPSQSHQQTSTDLKSRQGSPRIGLVKQPTRKGQKAGLQVSTNHSQGVELSFSAPPSLQPFFLDQDTATPGEDVPSSPDLKEEQCSDLDQHGLFSPPSPNAVKTCPSSPDDKEDGSTSHMDDLFDILIQTGEMFASFKPAPDPSLAHLRPNTPASSTPSSPLQLQLPPTTPPDPDTPQRQTPAEDQLQVPPAREQEDVSSAGSGRLEDFLESTTGKPLLGVEPGGPLTLIDDLHSQMLSTPSILEHPSSPSAMDTYELGYNPNPPGLDFGEQALDSMDWLDITMGGGGSEAPTLAPLGPPTPPSVFSADFLDGSDLQLHWDSCL